MGSVPGTDYGSWFDPNRDWMLNQDEKVNNASIYVDLLRAIKQADIRLSYDYSDSNNACSSNRYKEATVCHERF